MPHLEQTWRWYGPADPVSLPDIKQAGATGIVTALHHIPVGDVWEIGEIEKRKAQIEKAGLRWSVIESLPLTENIKTHSGPYEADIEKYQQSLENIGTVGLDTLCYNVMPVMDWTRTQLDAPFEDGSTALKFDMNEFACFDLHILKRPEAAALYTPGITKKAKEIYDALDDNGQQLLIQNIVAGLPGTDQHFTLDAFIAAVDRYKGLDKPAYRKNIQYFLDKVIPVAKKLGIKMAVHPDDPPFDILGLPRIVSTADDVGKYLALYPDPFHGLTFCTGSLGANLENDLPQMIDRYGDRVHFVHLRNVRSSDRQVFVEDNHLQGNVDMYEVMRKLIALDHTTSIPFRPDHGHRMLDDLNKKGNPGYTAIGRLRGLAELRGLELGTRRSLG